MYSCQRTFVPQWHLLMLSQWQCRIPMLAGNLCISQTYFYMRCKRERSFFFSFCFFLPAWALLNMCVCVAVGVLHLVVVVTAKAVAALVAAVAVEMVWHVCCYRYWQCSTFNVHHHRKYIPYIHYLLLLLHWIFLSINMYAMHTQKQTHTRYAVTSSLFSLLLCSVNVRVVRCDGARARVSPWAKKDLNNHQLCVLCMEMVDCVCACWRFVFALSLSLVAHILLSSIHSFFLHFLYLLAMWILTHS